MGLLGALFGKKKDVSEKRDVTSLEYGMEVYDKGRYQEAFPILLKAAEEGNAEAAYRCGWMFLKEKGTGEPQNFRKAVEWYEKAAELGHVEAQYECGSFYASNWGKDQKKDYAKSLYWYEKAAEAGNAKAQYQCGVIYEFAQGVRKDMRKALQYYEEAAVAGNAEAQEKCGRIYLHGEGTKKDMKKAAFWYETAATAGNLYAQKDYGRELYFGTYLPQNKERALYWLEKVLEKKGIDPKDKSNLCLKMYEEGVGGYRDENGKLFQQEIRAMKGSCSDQLYCGSMYRHNKEHRNDVRSFYWYRKAAEQGDPEAQFACGLICEEGKGTPQNQKLAEEWYQKAAEQNYAKAQYNLYLIYRVKKEDGADYKAERFLEAAAQGGFAKAQYALGFLYYEKQRYERAFELVLAAAEQGLPEAIDVIKAEEEITFGGKPSVNVSSSFHRILLDPLGGERKKAGCQVLFSAENRGANKDT